MNLPKLMIRITFLNLFLLCATLCFAQFPNNPGASNTYSLFHYYGAVTGDKGIVNGRYPDTTTANANYISGQKGAQIIVGNIIYLRDSTATKWIAQNSANGNDVPAGAIAAIPVVGTNPGTNISPTDWIINTFYVSPPTASISGGVTLALQSAQQLNYTLNYTSGRLASTKPIATIVVAGINEGFTQPSAPGSVSGTQAVSFPANTNITYSNVTTSTDGKSATASTTFSFLPERYFGWISDTTGIGTTGYDDSQIRALSNELSSSKSKSWSTGNPTGVQFLVYAYYSTAGNLTQFDMNGFPSLEAMNSVTRSFTNAEGFTGTWIIYWSKNGQTLSSTIVAN